MQANCIFLVSKTKKSNSEIEIGYNLCLRVFTFDGCLYVRMGCAIHFQIGKNNEAQARNNLINSTFRKGGFKNQAVSYVRLLITFHN